MTNEPVLDDLSRDQLNRINRNIESPVVEVLVDIYLKGKGNDTIYQVREVINYLPHFNPEISNEELAQIVMITLKIQGKKEPVMRGSP